MKVGMIGFGGGSGGGGHHRGLVIVLWMMNLVHVLVNHTTANAWSSSSTSSSSVVAAVNPPQTPKKLVVLGLGRVGLECAKLAVPSFHEIIGTVRSVPLGSTTSSPPLDDGIIRISIDDPSLVNVHLPTASHILWTIPLSMELLQADDNSLHSLFEVVEHCQQSQQSLWTGFVSTTGVYGNHEGGWVTEDSPVLCTSSSNANLYRTVEDRWYRMGGQIFRCAGIYDSHRSALHTVYNNWIRPTTWTVAGTGPVPSTEEAPTNRIHTNDIARAIVASMTLPYDPPDSTEERASITTTTSSSGRIYNLADDDPAPRSVVLAYAADLLESIGPLRLRTDPTESSSSSSTTMTDATPPTGSLTTTGSTMMTTTRERRRQTDRKLVSNRRMKQELVPELTYPSYREGLKAILMDPNTPWQQQQQQQQSAAATTTTKKKRNTN